jgi:hypothetical protein
MGWCFVCSQDHGGLGFVDFCMGCGFCVNPFGSACVCACRIWFMCEASRVWAHDHSSGHMFCMYMDEIL